MTTLWQDLRYGARMLIKHKGLTVISILSLALGIGANTAIFILVDAVLLKSLPVKEPEQLAQFKVSLSKNGEKVAEGSGRNSLRSPALCLGELASAIAKRSPEEALSGGELVSSGSLTEAPLIAPGETWTASLEGIDLSDLTLTTTA